MNLLLRAYQRYIQPRLHYGITLYSCSTQNDIDLVRFVPPPLPPTQTKKKKKKKARLITGNLDYMQRRGIDQLTLLTYWMCIQSARVDNIFWRHLCLKKCLWNFPLYCLIALICPARFDRIDMHLISMDMAAGKRDQWTFIFQLSTKRHIEIFFCYFGLIRQML